jgi:hypothetical protein
MTFSRLAKSGGCALAALALAGGAASWASAASLRDSLGASQDDRFIAPIEGRFRSDEGEGFVLDQAPGGALMMRYDANPEIWALQPRAGPRGDVIYRNDVGEQMLRATRVGGLILFAAGRPGGSAATFISDGPPLRLSNIPTPAALLQAMTLASARAGRAAQRTIAFDVDDAPLPSWPLVADAALVTAQAFQMVAADREAAKHLSGWRRVELAAGRSSGVTAHGGGTLRVVVDANKGVAGRPSSLKIAAVLAKPAKR